MRTHTVRANQLETRHIGLVVAHDVRNAAGTKFLVRKGGRIAAEIVAEIHALGSRELHLLEPESGEVHEDEAGVRVARAVAGSGVGFRGPFASEFTFTAEQRGLLRIDHESLLDVNRLGRVTVFTRFDHQPVDAGEELAGAKVTPLIVPLHTIEQVEAICAARPPLRVAPFRPSRVAALVMERVDARARDRFQAVLELKLAWFGSELVALRESNGKAGYGQILAEVIADRPDLVIVAGASSLDPLEPIFRALEEVNAKLVRHGVPVDPGSLLWLAYADDVPILGLPSSEMFSRRTSLELVLPRLFAGEFIAADDLAHLGLGGYLRQEMAFRFPDYEARLPGS
jgi:hypothetical protein